jgi:hypothetical protein
VASGTAGRAWPHTAWRRNATEVLPGSLALFAFIAVGLLLSWSAQAAFVAVGCILGFAAFAAPTTFWVIAALVSAFTFQGLTFMGLLPSLGTVLPIAVAWGALLVALLRRRAMPIPKSARPYVRWLLALFFVAIVSGFFNHVEILRPFLSIGLLGVPFVVLAAMLIDPPSARERSLLMKIAMALIVLQIPIAYRQFLVHGQRDQVEGTFVSRGGGSGNLATVAVIGMVWLLSRRPTLWRVALAATLAPLPFISDSKQVLFVFPIAVLVTAPQGLTLGYFVRSGLAIGLAALLLFVLPVRGAIHSYFHQDQRHGGTPKVQAAQWLWRNLSADPVSLTFGKGPAETVSLAAYYTTPGFLSASSPFHALGLKPAETAIELDYLAYGTVNNKERSSYQSALSSALGVFGDLGLAGVIVYGGLLVTLLLALAGRSRSPECIAAMSGAAMFALLGFIFDWWEHPGLPTFIGVLAGVALIEPAQSANDANAPAARRGARARFD